MWCWAYEGCLGLGHSERVVCCMSLVLRCWYIWGELVCVEGVCPHVCPSLVLLDSASRTGQVMMAPVRREGIGGGVVQIARQACGWGR